MNRPLGKLFFRNHVRSSWLVFFALWLACSGQVYADVASGLRIDLFAMPADSDQVYNLGEKISIVVVVKNISPWKITTRRLFSQSAFHNAIIVTGPNGEKYRPEAETDLDDMPPPIFWNDGKKTRELVPAELLEKEWVRSVTVDDLRDLIPVMKELPGSYTIECQQPFIRFAWTMELEPHGLLGVMDDRNWFGTVASENKIKIKIVPTGDSAKFRVRLEDLSSGNATPIGMNPVRIYKGNVYSPDDAWKKMQPVLSGTTDFDGWAVWASGDPCMPFDAYSAIAKYKNEYAQVLFGAPDENWASDCSGRIEKRILFGKPQERYSVYATNSVWVRNKVVVEGGNIGAPYPSKTDTWLSGKVEVDIGENVSLNDGVKVIGHRIALSSSASVFDLYYNEIFDAGAEINGAECSPIDAPAGEACLPSSNWHIDLSTFNRSITVEKKRIVEVDADQETRLMPGMYDDVYLAPGAVLKLDGGEYHFKNLYVSSNARVLCENSTEIRIEERLYPGSKSVIGMSSTAPEGKSAADVFILVDGINGTKALLNSVPEAAVIGEGSIVNANIYVPNGTLRIKEGCDVTGSFIAKDVVIGMKTRVSLDSYFQP